MFEGAECIETYDSAQDLIDSLKKGNELRDRRIANLTNEVNNEKDKVNVKDVQNSSLQEQVSISNADKIKAEKKAEKKERGLKAWRTVGLVAGGIILAEIVIVVTSIF